MNDDSAFGGFLVFILGIMFVFFIWIFIAGWHDCSQRGGDWVRGAVWYSCVAPR